MGEVLPPRRGLVSVQPIAAEEGGGLLIICDCGGLIQLVIEDVGAIIEPREIAVTCDGCQTSHWITITPQGKAWREGKQRG